MAGKRNGFLADAFHQATIARDHIGAVVDEVVAEARVEVALSHRHADRVGETLAERAGGRLDPGRVAEFRVARRLRAELAEIADLIERHAGIAGEVEQGIEQHRAVAGRQHKAVAVRPVRGSGVEFQEFLEQQGRAIGEAERQAAMAALGFLYGIHAERPDRIGER